MSCVAREMESKQKYVQNFSIVAIILRYSDHKYDINKFSTHLLKTK